MIVIVDYFMGNLGSIKNMLSRIGEKAIISNDPQVIQDAQKIILPGVGAFDKAMENLHSLGLVDPLNEAVLSRKVPILGICLGMQLLGNGSEEGTPTPGLGWIDANTIAFPEKCANLTFPHMGWSVVMPTKQGSILDSPYEIDKYYFVHTYHVQCVQEENVMGTAHYGVEFHAAIKKDNIMGTQFHPEKSHQFGLNLLHNFVKL